MTIILTTHYIEEAEEMADRIGVINKGEIMLVEDKAELMRKLGKKQLTLQLQAPLAAIPAAARAVRARASRDGTRARLHVRCRRPSSTGIAPLLRALGEPASTSRTCRPTQSSLEEIFVSLVRRPA